MKRFVLVLLLPVLALADPLPGRKTDLRPRPSNIPASKWVGATDVNGILDALSGTGDVVNPRVQATGSSTARTLAEHTRALHHAGDAWVNVKGPPYNAYGDGTHDDTAAIQAAINALPTGTFGGGTVMLPGGSYKITSPLTVPSGVTLRGASTRRTRIAVPSGWTAISVAGADGVVIEGMMFDGGGTAGNNPISITNSTRVSLRDLWIDSAEIGVYVSNSYFLDFTQVRVVSTTGRSFKMVNASNSITMVNCSVISGTTTHQAIEWDDSCAMAIVGSTFEGYAPIAAINVQGLSISGSYFESDYTPVAANSAWMYLGDGNGKYAQGVTLSGNQFNKGMEYVAHLATVSGFEANGNHIYTNAGVLHLYHYDTSPKSRIHLGVNDYNFNGTGYDATKLLVDWGTPTDSTKAASRSRVVFDGAGPPTTQAWALGDEVVNASPAEAGTAGSKYVITGWKCIAAGSPGTWVAMRVLTGN